MPAGRPRKNQEVDEAVSTSVENTETAENQAAPVPLAPLTQDTLLTLLASMQKQFLDGQKSQAENNKVLAEAIINLATPKAPLKSRKQEADEENERLFQNRQTDLEKMKKRNDAYLHGICEHIAGSNKIGEGFKDLQGRTSFQWHTNDVGVEFGICSICQKILTPLDPDYMEWRRKPQFGKPSSAGKRTVMNYPQAMADSFLHDS
jgi:hypothetical protein